MELKFLPKELLLPLFPITKRAHYFNVNREFFNQCSSLIRGDKKRKYRFLWEMISFSFFHVADALPRHSFCGSYLKLGSVVVTSIASIRFIVISYFFLFFYIYLFSICRYNSPFICNRHKKCYNGIWENVFTELCTKITDFIQYAI